MLKKCCIFMTVLATLSTIQPAYAVGSYPGAFVFGQIGGAMNDYQDIPQTNRRDNNLGWGAGLGYNFILAPNFFVAGEVSYSELGEARYTQADVALDDKNKFSAVNFIGTITWEYHNFNVFGETGIAIGMTNPNIQLGQMNNSLSSSTEGVYILGAGFGYQWEQLDFFARYDHYFGHKIDPVNEAPKFPNINAFYGGISYTFM